MINYMLDTNACIHVITGRVASVRERLQPIPPEQIGVSAVLVAELQFGISLAVATRRETNQEALNRFLEMVIVEDWPAKAAPGPVLRWPSITLAAIKPDRCARPRTGA